MGQDGDSAGKKLFIFLIFVGVVFGALYYFDIFNMRSRVGEWKGKLFDNDNQAATVTTDIQNERGQEIKLVSRMDWCETANIQVSDYPEEPESQKILGWDQTSSCCLFEVTGWNCAQNKSGAMQYCVTSQINPTIKYIRIDGNFNHNLIDFQDFVNDYDKRYIENKPCDITKY